MKDLVRVLSTDDGSHVGEILEIRNASVNPVGAIYVWCGCLDGKASLYLTKGQYEVVFTV
jgi:hypothetical protein